ncbi:type VI secretion system baseplate subunit TssE [Paraburkholderia sediminicola]|uniref:type VI secretion system baseplate subunit TssE n=1 Tax=Paraburkholderia sediminicola TaxID=458836 RepID=UPI0038BB6E5A
MHEKRLLERIVDYEAGGNRSQMTRADLLVGSIVAYLSRILNTRQGNAQFDPDFGVPDFTNLAASFEPNSVSSVANDIARMIRRYEPRLRSPRVIAHPQGPGQLSLSFSIEGSIALGEHDIPVRLSTRVASDGRVWLSDR